ncbi:hypothetical protein HYPSUDRAFT_53993 [Hypholoma sublateritium FD-334 SS-4]|uniref:Uncharacterized protein n=1 Tax=Hypholoma sublateritium (strain FD-334 SS-4) TaxID=945553 RepID=A0A0D2PXH3_HYPSF|nr:hypothetical protein HYPSUDRAFT_53993 [Hypholoma sublateritium FD-334 SS-4]
MQVKIDGSKKRIDHKAKGSQKDKKNIAKSNPCPFCVKLQHALPYPSDHSNPSLVEQNVANGNICVQQPVRIVALRKRVGGMSGAYRSDSPLRGMSFGGLSEAQYAVVTTGRRRDGNLRGSAGKEQAHFKTRRGAAGMRARGSRKSEGLAASDSEACEAKTRRIKRNSQSASRATHESSVLSLVFSGILIISKRVQDPDEYFLECSAPVSASSLLSYWDVEEAENLLSLLVSLVEEQPHLGYPLTTGVELQIYLGTPTTTAVEWHISPSATWSATVSVGYYQVNDASQEVTFTGSRQQLGSVCSSPLELASLLRKAEHLVLCPGAGLMRILSSENQRNRGRPLLTHTANATYGGIIYVALKYPEIKFKEVKILDTPGLVDGVGYPLENIHIRKLIATYSTQTRPIMAVVLPSRSYLSR